MQFAHGGLHGFEQHRLRLQVEVDAMGNHFSIGFRSEHVAQGLQFGAQLFVVFNDAVVHDGDAVA